MKPATGGVIMAFDFGLRHIGVALGQTVTHTATGVATLKAKDGKPDWRALQRLLEEYRPTQLVVGLPLNMDGSPSEMSDLAGRFAEQLGRRSGLAVTMQDERLSSHAAKAAFEDAKAAGQASTEHELAACLILSGWLES